MVSVNPQAHDVKFVLLLQPPVSWLKELVCWPVMAMKRICDDGVKLLITLGAFAPV